VAVLPTPTATRSRNPRSACCDGRPRHLEVLAQLNQEVWYRSGDDYAAWARETFARDKALIERLGLAAK
jgi:hypothetical protein